jgi:hypothetical protein
LVLPQRSPSGQVQFPLVHPPQFESQSGRLAQRPFVQTFRQQSPATLQGAPSPWQARQNCPSHPRPTQQPPPPPPPPPQAPPTPLQKVHFWLQTPLQQALALLQSLSPEMQFPWTHRFAPLQEEPPVQAVASQMQIPWMQRSPAPHAVAHPTIPPSLPPSALEAWQSWSEPQVWPGGQSGLPAQE